MHITRVTFRLQMWIQLKRQTWWREQLPSWHPEGSCLVRDGVETQLGCEGRKVTWTAMLRRLQTRASISLIMSLCPPFAPFFGFAGVASAVSGAFVVKKKEFNLDCNRWSLAVRSLTGGRPDFEMTSLIRNDSCRCCLWDLQGRHRDCGTWNFQAWTHYESSSSFIVMFSKPAEGFLQSLIPVVMSGIIAVYGLVVSVLIAGARKSQIYCHSHSDIMNSEATRLLSICWVRSSGRWLCLRSYRAGCRICYWSHRWFGNHHFFL